MFCLNASKQLILLFSILKCATTGLLAWGSSEFQLHIMLYSFWCYLWKAEFFIFVIKGKYSWPLNKHGFALHRSTYYMDLFSNKYLNYFPSKARSPWIQRTNNKHWSTPFYMETWAPINFGSGGSGGEFLEPIPCGYWETTWWTWLMMNMTDQHP